MTTIIRFLPLLFLLWIAAPSAAQAVVPAIGAPITFAQTDGGVTEASGSEGDATEEKVAKPPIKKYLIWGLSGLVALLFIWFFVRPFIQGLAGKGPQKDEKKS